jgi:hypothetical protein
LVDSTAKSLTRQALENIHKQIKAIEEVQAEPATEQPVAQATAVPQAAPAPERPKPVLEAPSQTQFILDVAKDVLDDLIPAGQRPLIGAAVGLLILFIISEWWTMRLAKRVARILEKRR